LSQVRSLLRRHFLFRDLDEDVLCRLEGLAAAARPVPAGGTIFLKGDEGDALYGVLSGRVRISTGSPSGKLVLLNIMEAGEIFGEIALIDGRPRTADATALTACELVALRRADFRAFLEREPLLAIHLLEMLCERVRRTSERIEDTAFLGVPARLAKRLLQMAEHDGAPAAGGGVRVAWPLSQGELGQMLGMSRESLNKRLHRWQARGWIAVDRRGVTIRDRGALLALIEANDDA
jgi:CRP-like cAMP-binding protein